MNRKKGVVAIIYYGEKVLIGKKRSDSLKSFAGKWHIPGEGLNPRESDEQGLVRLMKEEAGSDLTEVTLTLGKFICKSYSPSGRILKWYECFASNDKICYGGDLEDAKYVNKKEVLKECDSKVVCHWPKQVIDYFNS